MISKTNKTKKKFSNIIFKYNFEVLYLMKQQIKINLFNKDIKPK